MRRLTEVLTGLNIIGANYKSAQLRIHCDGDRGFSWEAFKISPLKSRTLKEERKTAGINYYQYQLASKVFYYFWLQVNKSIYILFEERKMRNFKICCTVLREIARRLQYFLWQLLRIIYCIFSQPRRYKIVD